MYKENIAREKVRGKIYKQNNIIRETQRNREYQTKNKDEILAKAREGRSELKDNYVKTVIAKQFNYKINAYEIPLEAIELKRTNLLLKRTIKNQKNDQSIANI